MKAAIIHLVAWLDGSGTDRSRAHLERYSGRSAPRVPIGTDQNPSLDRFLSRASRQHSPRT